MDQTENLIAHSSSRIATIYDEAKTRQEISEGELGLFRDSLATAPPDRLFTMDQLIQYGDYQNAVGTADGVNWAATEVKDTITRFKKNRA